MTSPSVHNGSLYDGPRHLNDDVLQSAEEAVLTTLPSELPPAELAPFSDAQVPRKSAQRYQEALAQYVAAKPCKSALWAMLAGAASVTLLRSVVSRRRS